METTSSKKPNKYLALAIYLFAVVCLLLGLFLPFWGENGILALQLPDLLNKMANTQLVSTDTEFALSYNVNIFCTGVNLDVMVIYALLYVVVSLASLLALIPIGISTKKGTGTACVFMRIVETAAVIVTSVYVLIAFHAQCDSFAIFEGAQLRPFSICMAIAFGGSLLALIVHNIAIKKGSGVAKTLILVLAIVAVVALYDLTGLIPSLGGLAFAPSLFASYNGINFANGLFAGGLLDMLQLEFTDLPGKIVLLIATALSCLVIINFFIDVIGLSTNAKNKKPAYIFNIVRYVLEALLAIGLLIAVFILKYTLGLMLIVIAAIALVQFLINLICLLKKPTEREEAETASAETLTVETNEEKTQTVTEVVAEATQSVAEAKPVAESAEEKSEEPEPVLMEQPVEEAELISPDNNTVELKKEEKGEPAAEEDFEPVQEEIPLPPQADAPVISDDGWDEPASFDSLQEPRHTVQPEVAPIPVRQSSNNRANYPNEPEIKATQIYTINTIYGGPVDDFMRKLTNEEKIEFAMTFIEKSKGNIGNIPDYVIGGNNKQFFSSVFIYLGRIRGLISDGLLNKMYKEINLL